MSVPPLPEWTSPEAALLVKLSRPSLTESEAEYCRNVLEEHRKNFDWGFFVDQAGRHKVLPLIGRNIHEHFLHRSDQGAPLIPYRWLYGAAYTTNRRRNEALTVEFTAILSAIASTDVRFAVRKGLVLAETLYGNYGLRRMVDLDILTERRDVQRIGAVLENQGYRQGRRSKDGTSIEEFDRSTRAYWRLNVNNELPYMKISDLMEVDYFAVDLCTDLSQRKTETVLPTSELLDRRVEVRLGGGSSFALAPEDQFIDLCLHLYKEATSRYYIETGVDLQLLKFLDVALSNAAIVSQGGWRQTLQRIHHYQATAGVYYAMYHAGLLYPEYFSEFQFVDLSIEDHDFLDDYGTLDGQVGRWRNSFQRRLFSTERRDTVDGKTTVPRP
jgi:hypothetical protein